MDHSSFYGQLPPVWSAVVGPPQSQETVDTVASSTVIDAVVRLVAHEHFQHYFDIIVSYLSAPKDVWEDVVRIRRSKCDIWLLHHRSIRDTPPPDIFHMLAEIRNDKEWERSRPMVLNHVRQKHNGFSPELQRSHRTTNANDSLLMANPLFTPSTRSRSRDSHLPTASTGSSFGAAGSGRRQANRRGELHGNDQSPTPASTHGFGRSDGRTAPQGFRYECPSKQCQKRYTRLGFFENHLATSHPDLNLERRLHNPQAYLRRTRNLEHFGSDVLLDDQPGQAIQGNLASPNPLNPFAGLAGPYTQAPISSQVGDGLRGTLTPDTVLNTVMGAVGQDIPPNVQTRFGAPLCDIQGQNNYQLAYSVQDNLPEGDLRGISNQDHPHSYSSTPFL